MKKQFPRPRTRKIPFDLVKNFLKKKGYSVIKIWRPWRHVVAIVKKDNQPLFFKMATTLKTSQMTENEFNWNKRVLKQLDPQAPFIVPQNIEKGYFQKRLFFVINEYFGDQTLAEKYPPQTKRLDQWTIKIAQASYLISQINGEAEERQKEKPIGDHLSASASEWFSQLKSNLQPLLKVISQARFQVKRAFNHGDFVPWHMYALKNNKFGLTDAEHGGFGAQYYDVAYFYTRVRQSLEEKELARKFLLEFRKLLLKKEQNNFWSELKPVVAQRLIGDFWGAETGTKELREKELGKCELFKKDLIANKII